MQDHHHPREHPRSSGGGPARGEVPGDTLTARRRCGERTFKANIPTEQIVATQNPQLLPVVVVIADAIILRHPRCRRADRG